MELQNLNFDHGQDSPYQCVHDAPLHNLVEEEEGRIRGAMLNEQRCIMCHPRLSKIPASSTLILSLLPRVTPFSEPG